MKQLFMVLAFMLLWSLAASAQDDYGADRIGIFADLEALSNQIDLEAGTPREIYVLILNPTGDDELGGAEWRIEVPDNVTVWGWNFPMSDAMAFSSPPDFMVVWTQDPLPYQAINHVMTFIIVPSDSEPALFYIDVPQYSGAGEAPRYLDWNTTGSPRDELYDLVPYPDGLGQPSFAVNAGALPVVAVSWSDVKALYN